MTIISPLSLPPSSLLLPPPPPSAGDWFSQLLKNQAAAASLGTTAGGSNANALVLSSQASEAYYKVWIARCVGVVSVELEV